MIVEPFTEIIGGKDVFIDQHSVVNLTCIVHAPDKPAHIFWLHNKKVTLIRNSYKVVFLTKYHILNSRFLILRCQIAKSSFTQLKWQLNLWRQRSEVKNRTRWRRHRLCKSKCRWPPRSELGLSTSDRILTLLPQSVTFWFILLDQRIQGSMSATRPIQRQWP